MAVPENDSLETIAAEVSACVRCRLSTSRRTAVPGEGPAGARLMVIGEGPGNSEDLTGRPFVGEAGRMLTRMLEDDRSLGIPRSQVFITNVVKCHPPGNRDPEPDETAACRPYLDRQVALVRPRAILILGRIAAQALLATRDPIGRLRGNVVTLFGVPAMPTFHPAYLLRTPGDKKVVFQDILALKKILEDDAGGTP
jgi:DNA polymerase